MHFFDSFGFIKLRRRHEIVGIITIRAVLTKRQAISDVMRWNSVKDLYFFGKHIDDFINISCDVIHD